MKPSSISLWSISLLALVLLPSGAAEAGWRDRVIIEDGWYDVPRPPRPVGGFETYDDDTYADPGPVPVPEPGYGDDDPSLGLAPEEIDPEDTEPGGDYDGEYETQRSRLNTRAARPRGLYDEAGPAVVPGLAPASPARRRTTLVPDDEISKPPRTRAGKAKPTDAQPAKGETAENELAKNGLGKNGLAKNGLGKNGLGKSDPVKIRSARAKSVDPGAPRTVPAATPPKPAPAKVVDEPQTTAALGKPLPEGTGAKPVLGARASGAGSVALPVKRPNQEVLDFEPIEPTSSSGGERR